MKFNITSKLFILVALPIVTLLIFSFNHIQTKYSLLTSDKEDLIYIDIMQSSTNLVHELQIERGAGASYLKEKDSDHFKNLLHRQRKATQKSIEQFKKSIKNISDIHTSKSTKIYLRNINEILLNMQNIRNMVDTKEIELEKYFKYFTILNKNIITLFKSFKLYSTSVEVQSRIEILKKIVQLQEYAGQERALLNKIQYNNFIKERNIRLFHNLVDLQKERFSQINFLLKGTKLELKLEEINQKYQDTYFQTARNIINNNERRREKRLNELIENHLKFLEKGSTKYQNSKDLQASLNINRNYTISQDIKIDNKKWFDISSERINDMHAIETKFFTLIKMKLKQNIEDNTNSLKNQIFLTVLTILLLLVGTFWITRNIRYSIYQLKLGIDDFFKFLHSHNEKPKYINTNSKDEINDMAQSINKQIKMIEHNLEDDRDFINEATQIVTLMKDGDFSERLYFEPNNQNLKELKDVLNELIELISQKIKEQTDSLERLNRSLEDRVYKQTIELEKQIKEITISRDKAIQAEIAKDEFLANMSHEIRTPLNAILGFVTILKKQIKDEKPLKYLNIIDTSGKSLLTIINDILDFSKIQSGKFVISPYDIDPVDEFSNVSLLFASKAYEKHLLYSVYIDPNIPQTINVDAVRVKQIFSNILSNAIKFTHEDGEIKVTVTCQNSRLTISIEDNGIGIAEENISKVFKAFEQADGSTTRKYGGTGLGLSISYRLAQLMDGDLYVVSKEGEGSTFTLELPVKIVNSEPKLLIDNEKLQNHTFAILAEEQNSKKQILIKKYLEDFGVKNILILHKYQPDGYDLLFFVPSDEYNEDIVDSKTPAIALLRNSSIKLANLEYIHALYTPFTPSSIVQAINDSGIDKIVQAHTENKEDEEEVEFEGSILVAEDNKTNQMLISLILDDYGLDYKIANNGLEAVEMFKKEQFDLVLMDENMPELNGIGAMQQIKEYENNNSLIMTPILALTASVLDTDKEMFIKAGMDGFVGKPIDNDELESELSRFLTKK
jgi:signal transduction histidine kinase/CheY-like chemotaxis protein